MAITGSNFISSSSTDAGSTGISAAEHLRSIGAYGFDKTAPLVMAALVTEDPLLLIGESGTGKTFLLNSLSEALGLEHRHYNASLLSFDDLVGFPFPNEAKNAVTFLETPATVWQAESVLIDEISRCKPEHQNRLFSLIHERRVQGMALGRLRFRWAAMNPCSADQDPGTGYAGSEPLDQALGDRFGLFLTVLDWDGLDEGDRRLIANPAGEGAVTANDGRLAGSLARWRAEFRRKVECCPAAIVGYAVTAATFLNGHGLRVSPRRARFMSRSLLAAAIVSGGESRELFREVLAASLTQPSLGKTPEPALVEAAHKLAWDSNYLAGDGQWVHRFHAEHSLPRKLRMLLRSPGLDAASQAIAEFIGSGEPERVAAFCMALYPAASGGIPGIGAEGVNDIGKIAVPMLSIDAEITWQDRGSVQGSVHPGWIAFSRVLDRLEGARKSRARQFFNYLLVASISPDDPEALEAELDACVSVVRGHLDSLGRNMKPGRESLSVEAGL
jgi:MoxR-like ATPase